MIYFVQGISGGLVKIGVAQNPDKRLRDMQIGSPVVLRLLKIEEGDRDRELELHAQFGELHVRGEWFYPARDLAVYAGAIQGDPDVEEVIRSARETGFIHAEERAQELAANAWKEALQSFWLALDRLAPFRNNWVSVTEEGQTVERRTLTADDADDVAFAARCVALGICEALTLSDDRRATQIHVHADPDAYRRAYPVTPA